MADIKLKTDYKDDVLDTSVNERRKYQMIQNEDGTVSFVDVTEYSKVGDSFGAADINATNNAVNELNSDLSSTIKTVDDMGKLIQLFDDGATEEKLLTITNNYKISDFRKIYVMFYYNYNVLAQLEIPISRFTQNTSNKFYISNPIGMGNETELRYGYIKYVSDTQIRLYCNREDRYIRVYGEL